MNVGCIFAGVKDERPKGNEPMYECVHGKILTWATARRMLGLPVERPNQDITAKGQNAKEDNAIG